MKNNVKRSWQRVEGSSVLGDCVACGGPALSYTGATTTSDGKFRCARCTLTLKESVKVPKSVRGRGSRELRRDYPEPPAVFGARWVQLGEGRMALVDAADYKLANLKSWFYFGGHAVRREYWGGRLRHDYLHRFVLGLGKRETTEAPPTIEFIDKNPLNCCKANLRVVKKPRAAEAPAREARTARAHSSV